MLQAEDKPSSMLKNHHFLMMKNTLSKNQINSCHMKMNATVVEAYIEH